MEITDGSAVFEVKNINEINNVVKQVNGKYPVNGNVDITDITGNAATASNIQATGNALGSLLLGWLHRYGVNYVPADTSNQGWNALGICIIYYDEANKFKNQPGQYGQLLNIPVDSTGQKSRQIWIPQFSGQLLQRGGNASTVMNDQSFAAV
ncbi:hypothetical protein [uncultured Megasphaera sp.]|uniref:hypothetical protein n=1 Tax=uncultured Megasphaera sp. TaxID=165188 RepID=UPI002659FADE|nr:hypothetical protein [uncultured Megasphaera sp.]